MAIHGTSAQVFICPGLALNKKVSEYSLNSDLIFFADFLIKDANSLFAKAIFFYSMYSLEILINVSEIMNFIC